jgi:pentatricopeptide repeat protein
MTVSPVRLTEGGVKNMVEKLAEQYAKFGAVQKAIDVVEKQVAAEMSDIRQTEQSGELTDDHVHWKTKQLRSLVMSITPIVLQQQHGSSALTLSTALQMARLSDSLGLLPHRPLAPYYLHAYGQAKARGEALTLSYRDWDLLLFASTAMDLPPSDEDGREMPKLNGYAFRGTSSLLQDLRQFGIPLEKLNPATIRRVVRSLYFKLDAAKIGALFAKLGPDYGRLLNNPQRDLQAFREHDKTTNAAGIECLNAKGTKVTVDAAYSRIIDEHFGQNPRITPTIAYSRFEAALRKNVYPTPASLGRLINALGRLGQLDKVRKLYETAQTVLSSMDNQKQWQSQGWFQVEDNMIIALAHAGDLDAAHVHRVRILEQGGSPSADAYGALIHSVKDTTDDTSNAMALFRESQMQGVAPSIYLYNTIISKLAKARKADFALELFQQMKANNFRPSSITFGAVIAACARVGDTYSAEMLFSEMISQPNFKPRIPPYNTMMQMYTSTKPDRERALYYYDALLHARIQPSAHTYKVRHPR